MADNKFEKARKVGARAFQLALNALPNINVNPEEIGFLDPVYVAYVEYEKGKTPLKVVKK
ncbi:MAG: DNA-directed RNA polymerase subunit K [Candidatus Micrarchaeota archaeon]|nr:DNA-directed RNA polymerase subunit K [Candidatus Micrarchaeota archaeon]